MGQLRAHISNLRAHRGHFEGLDRPTPDSEGPTEGLDGPTGPQASLRPQVDTLILKIGSLSPKLTHLSP